jgi:YbgC/YbaW family acyl-CoA thioester hydrolase
MNLNTFHYYPRFHEFDSYGIIHHSAYFCWFEEGRVLLLQDLGTTQKMLKEENIEIVLQSINAEFITPISSRIQVEIVTALDFRNFSRLKFKHSVRCPVTKRVYASAEIEAVARDLNGPTVKISSLLNKTKERVSHAS